jgi:uncharacterized OB-fold protein
MSEAAAPKPVPVPDADSAEYWKAAADHVLALQRCTVCGWYAYPTTQVCKNCFSPTRSFRFEPVSGHATVKTWTVMRDAFLPGFRDDVPYVVVEAELAEQPGLTMVGRLQDEPDGRLRLGAPLAVVFEDMADDVAVPAFALAPQTTGDRS